MNIISYLIWIWHKPWQLRMDCAIIILHRKVYLLEIMHNLPLNKIKQLIQSSCNCVIWKWNCTQSSSSIFSHNKIFTSYHRRLDMFLTINLKCYSFGNNFRHQITCIQCFSFFFMFFTKSDSLIGCIFILCLKYSLPLLTNDGCLNPWCFSIVHGMIFMVVSLSIQVCFESTDTKPK